MLCEKCSQREATSYFKQMINGKTTTFHLCTDCAEKMGMNHLFYGLQFNVDDIFGGLLGNFSSTAPSMGTTVCPECHSDLNTIIQTGKIGCAKCYTTFRKEILPTIEQLHGKVTHQGKLPRSAGENARKKAQLTQLKNKLDEAIHTQNFEDAAKYRDEIHKLEGEQHE